MVGGLKVISATQTWERGRWKAERSTTTPIFLLVAGGVLPSLPSALFQQGQLHPVRLHHISVAPFKDDRCRLSRFRKTKG